MNQKMMETAENKGEQLDDYLPLQNNESTEIINRLISLAFAYCPVPLNS
jgi:hypothetical protein